VEVYGLSMNSKPGLPEKAFVRRKVFLIPHRKMECHRGPLGPQQKVTCSCLHDFFFLLLNLLRESSSVAFPMWLSSRRNIYDTAGGFSHLRERDRSLSTA
jgi:hypothetical protein